MHGCPRPTFMVPWVVVGLITAAANAHDLWLAPQAHMPSSGQAVPVLIRVGHGGQSDVIARDAQRVVRFEQVKPDGTATPAPAPAGGNPAAIVHCDEPGLHQIVYRSNAAHIELPAEKFEAYLREEGLEKISALRAARGETAKPGRERYSRSVKTLLWSQPAANDASIGAQTPPLVGLPLELNPQCNPFRAKSSDEVAFVLLRDGQPLPGALVSARAERPASARAAAPAAATPADQEIRTDERGAVRFRLTSGKWVVATVWMEPSTSPEADWESTWASVTFAIP